MSFASWLIWTKTSSIWPRVVAARAAKPMESASSEGLPSRGFILALVRCSVCAYSSARRTFSAKTASFCTGLLLLSAGMPMSTSEEKPSSGKSPERDSLRRSPTSSSMPCSAPPTSSVSPSSVSPLAPSRSKSSPPSSSVSGAFEQGSRLDAGPSKFGRKLSKLDICIANCCTERGTPSSASSTLARS